ncbi:class E sortase [Streptomyces sp. NPDC058221]|uniref:class E sortase n=1 Tax=Streptomyces sp. NPDC058221 TaxID=3346388 RepID=UPI0036EFF815
MRAVRERIPVVVQHNPRGRLLAARGLWTGAELVVTLGIVLLLLVAHQLWWTNRQARAGAAHTVQALQHDWGEPAPGPPETVVPESTADDDSPAVGAGEKGEDGKGRGTDPAPAATAPRRSQAYAVIRIPRIGLTAPVAQGISRSGVLDKGYVGHYPGTAQPGGSGNFALAAHRNTHGEPFRYINRLRRGDRLTVETRDTVYTYTVDKTLPQTGAGDSGVVAAVPRSNVKPYVGYRAAGSYVTLTTCTPEFTSRYRLVVWGKLTDVRGK